MRDEELLEALKSEMLLTEARSRGAKEAYESEAINQARRLLREEHNIRPNDIIIVNFTDRAVIYEYRDMVFDFIKNEPALTGRRFLKSGKLSKNNCNEFICGISYLHNVTKYEQWRATCK